MKKKLPFLFIFIILISCRQNNEENLEKNTNAIDLYVAGAENNKACYWKNNQQNYLSGGDDIISANITFENNNIYLTGYNQFTDDLKFFWKNNVKYDIRQYLNISSNLYLKISNFTVKNNDIYFTGVVENPSPATSNDKYEHSYWKNGVKTVLNKSANKNDEDFRVGSICIYNSKVYTIGRKTINNVLYDGYYEGIIFHEIIPVLNSSLDRICNLATNDNNLYVSGQKNGLAFYKNLLTGIETQPSQTSQLFSFPTIILNGNDVYTVQYQGYYKNNGTYTPITIDPDYQLCSKMIILNQNFYTIRIFDSNYTGGKVYINNVQVMHLPAAQLGVKQVLTDLFVKNN
ncbi:hypothetical protein [Chryseobacterium oryctis]|uniref:Lipoprotein n=1 Tax=Chryseobacterium oryctis TaxID=2952618 RepID=A0ABT3HJ46_9FLAO|nr:hypothetical protein [Chryseobacterium oryctis]MCW3159718.1 hypothetical protein [Chryseobacterium oryctis]